MKEYDIGDEKMEQQAWIRKRNSNPPEIEIREKNDVTIWHFQLWTKPVW